MPRKFIPPFSEEHMNQELQRASNLQVPLEEREKIISTLMKKAEINSLFERATAPDYGLFFIIMALAFLVMGIALQVMSIVTRFI